MTRIAKFREKNRKAWEARNGVKLTYLPFIAKALLHGIRVKPIINASVVGDGIQYHKNVNIGIAVALEWGLIVPVVKGAENLSFVGLQRAIVDLGERARTKKLKPDDVQGGTITITNPGIYGPQFGLPIILQPQVAILGSSWWPCVSTWRISTKISDNHRFFLFGQFTSGCGWIACYLGFRNIIPVKNNTSMEAPINRGTQGPPRVSHLPRGLFDHLIAGWLCSTRYRKLLNKKPKTEMEW
jgi:hypothetical protein